MREISELPTIKRNLGVQSWLPKMSKLLTTITANYAVIVAAKPGDIKA